MLRPTTSEPRRGLPRTPRAALVAAALVVALPLAGLVVARSAVQGRPELRSFSFVPLSDWYVSAEAPSRVFNGRWLQTSNSNRHHAQTYLRFRLDGLTGGVTRARLRVHAESANRGGFLVVSVPPDA
jgi:hypothetical protein